MTSQFILDFNHATPFRFSLGGSIPELTLRYECHGRLNARKDNVILVNHSLSTDSHVHSHPDDPRPGWWEGMIGPGKTLDTNQFFIICINNLGGCGGSSGPTSTNPLTGKPYRADFPQTTFQDMVASQKLLLETLGIEHLHAIVAYSMGAMISLAWAFYEPKWVTRVVLASSCYKAYPTNIANRAIQRRMIELDPCWRAGHYDQSNFPGFNLARELAMLSYRTAAELNTRFPDLSGRDSLANYLDYNAQKFTDRFDANCYLNMLGAMDAFNLCRSNALSPDFHAITARCLVIGVDSDVLYPPNQQTDLYQALRTSACKVDYIEHHSAFGHDAFVLDGEAMNRYIRPFLETPLTE